MIVVIKWISEAILPIKPYKGPKNNFKKNPQKLVGGFVLSVYFTAHTQLWLDNYFLNMPIWQHTMKTFVLFCFVFLVSYDSSLNRLTGSGDRQQQFCLKHYFCLVELCCWARMFAWAFLKFPFESVRHSAVFASVCSNISTRAVAGSWMLSEKLC